MTTRAALTGGLLLWLLTACNGTAHVPAGPVTPDAIETIARDHLDDPSSSGAGELDGSDPHGSVAARLRYDDEHVDVVVGPPHRPNETAAHLCDEGYVECADLDTDVDGGTLTLLWQEQVPEEDPGIIVLVLEREGECSLVRWGGDVVVSGDPRDLDLAVPVDDAVDLLEDERLRLDVPDASPETTPK